MPRTIFLKQIPLMLRDSSYYYEWLGGKWEGRFQVVLEYENGGPKINLLLLARRGENCAHIARIIFIGNSVFTFLLRER